MKSLLESAEAIIHIESVDNVIFSLGTNDVTQNKTDQDVVNISMSTAINKVKGKFPNANIAVCSVLPRKGKSPGITKMNLTSSFVNTFVQKMCRKDHRLTYIDLWEEFFSTRGSPTKSLYDSNDPSGVHVCPAGAQVMYEAMEEFIGVENLGEFQTPSSRKRKKSTVSTPGSIEKQQPKIHKQV